MQPDLKRYVVRKYVMARTAEEAIMKEGSVVVDEVFLDEEWMKEHKDHSSIIGAIGFVSSLPERSGANGTHEKTR